MLLLLTIRKFICVWNPINSFSIIRITLNLTLEKRTDLCRFLLWQTPAFQLLSFHIYASFRAPFVNCYCNYKWCQFSPLSVNVSHSKRYEIMARGCMIFIHKFEAYVWESASKVSWKSESHDKIQHEKGST